MTSQKSKQEQDFDFMPHWKDEEKCYEETKIEGKDTYTGKKVSSYWPRDKPQEQIRYELWLQKVRDPDTGKFYEQIDKNGNTVKGTGPKHLIRQIVRIRTNDGKQFLYSNGYILGYDVVGDPVREVCSNPETWQRTGFMYKKEYDPNSRSLKTKVEGPNLQETIYKMSFNEKNLKVLFDKRITPENIKELGQKRMSSTVSFSIKDEKNNVVRDIRDAQI